MLPWPVCFQWCGQEGAAVRSHNNRDTLKALEQAALRLWPPRAFRRDPPSSGLPWHWPLESPGVALASLSGCATATAAEKANALAPKDAAGPELAAEVVSDAAEAPELAFWVSEWMEAAALTPWEASELAQAFLF